MADLVDNMTPAELRTKLAEYGLPVMPITASTRNLMVKKLKLVMESKGDNKNGNSRRSLAKYSSGEDSDLDVSKTTKEKSKNRRTTVGGAMPPPVTSKLRKPTPKKSDSPAKLDNDKDSESDSEPIKTQEEVKTVTTRRITRTYKPSLVDHEEYETGSDSDVDVKTTSTTTYKSPLTSSHAYTSLADRSDFLSERSDFLASTLPSVSALRSDLTVNPPVSSYTTSSDLNSIRSRLGLTSNYGDRSSGGYSSYQAPVSSVPEEVNSPYLSSFTRRLSAMKADTKNSHKDTDISNGNSGTSTKYPFYKSAYRKRGDYAPDFKTAGEKNVLKNNLVSFAIVGVGLVFFLGVGLMYLGMKGEPALHIEDKNIIQPKCHSGMIPSVDCVNKEDIPKALELLKIIHPALTARSVAVTCGENSGPPYMSEPEVIQYVENNFKNAKEKQIQEDLHNLHVLIVNNPKWGVSILSVDPYKQNSFSELVNMDYVVPKREKGSVALAVLHPTIPWRCYITGFLYYAALVLLAVGSVGSVVFLIYKAFKAYADYNKRRKEQIYSMVEQIIDLLSQENGEDGSDPAGQSMPISHVRDMLIPPQKREKMTAIWDAAIQFIEKNESRVRFEVESTAGEEYRSLRWVSPQGSPRARGPGARSWQGQAFETQEGSVNNLTISPTPCLKIRHMVEKGDKNPNTKIIIQDAIIEKCGPLCKILHMEVDKATCCVYVKCASPADAGIVYQSLHGWWYEGNLITVKYLRLERYMDHFPSSPASGPYLKPSHK